MRTIHCGLGMVFLLLQATYALAQPPVAEKTFTPDAIVNAEAFYPEGPQLIEEGMLTAEMPKDRIVLITPKKTEVVWSRPGCGPTSIKRLPAGGYWVLCHLGHYVVRLDQSFQTLRTLAHTTIERRLTWPNDASVDTQGNLYLSSPGQFSLAAPAVGYVSFIDAASNEITDIADGLRYSNGVLVQEQHKRVLVSEHLNKRVLAFPLLDKGKLGAPSVFFDFKNAPPVSRPYELSGPDGLAAFTDSDILVADYGNSRLLLLSHQGKFIKEVPVQYRYVTNMAIMPDQQSLFVLMTESNVTPPLHGIVQRFKVTAKAGRL